MAVSTTALQIQDEKFKSLGLDKKVVNAEQVCSYSRNLGAATDKNPVLVLIHGYPQSSYMWRHLIPLLPPSAPIFAVDLPGYGASAPLEKHDKLSIGNAIIAALRTEVKRTSSSPPSAIPIVLIGHDRGARVAHRLAVSGAQSVDIFGICLIDIVPTTTQWAASTNPREVTTYFHWLFLANVSLAIRMITSFGPANWCTEMINNWSGKSPSGQTSLKSDDSLSVYTNFFAQPHTLEASCKDYEAGASVDVDAQKEDQTSGRKIRVPLLLVYSEGYIGGRYDFPDVWEDWVGEGVSVRTKSWGNGIGHFGAEEAPEETAGAIKEWLGEL
ncbi:alpha/beta-hydrolase [Lentithecium fluviatile CBS 122367]|uniref:Alpha/beta-hydrolase n=1 Tax=Lentithecium fluviatile CBS 122367 TaxID=1168545 RepID=A0A6G1IDX7_9PLEO|nr:alpha/beta-hydrolase [Lentithecium fluviatile CBS 122367]